MDDWRRNQDANEELKLDKQELDKQELEKLELEKLELDKQELTRVLSSNFLILTIMILLWILAVAAANPAGNFPLNDDWNYAQSVNSFLSTGKLSFTVWTLAASLSHVLAGSLFCKAFGGFSFENLRLLSQISGLMAGLCFYLVAYQLSRSKKLSFLCACSLILNPIFFNLSQTFMTDIFFIFLSILTSLFALKPLRNIERAKWSEILLLALSSVLCCLSRQIGIVLPLAFLFATLMCFFSSDLKLGSRPSILLKAMTPLLISLAAIIGFQIWLDSQGVVLLSYKTEQAYLSGLLAGGPLLLTLHGLTNLFRSGIYLGLFLFPFLIAYCSVFAQLLIRKQKLFFLVLTAELFITVFLGLIWKNSMMPLGDNILFDCGLGPILSPEVSKGIIWTKAPGWVWSVITAIGTLGAALLTSCLILGAMISRQANFKAVPTIAINQRQRCFFILACLFFMLTICLRGFFDRYLLFPIPLLCSALLLNLSILKKSVVSPTRPRPGFISTAISSLILSGFLVFSVLACHDYFAFNRVRWDLLNQLTDDLDIPPALIDGGLEFNGWKIYQENVENKSNLNADMKRGDDYIVSLKIPNNYETLQSEEFERWLPPGRGHVYAAKRKDSRGPELPELP